MLCPIQTFKVLPHIIEAIFVTHLGSYGDFMRCKTVNKAWREALDAIEQHASNNIKYLLMERRFTHKWFEQDLVPTLEIEVNAKVDSVSIEGDQR